MQVAHCNPDIFHHFQERVLAPTGHWERDLKKKNGKGSKTEPHAPCASHRNLQYIIMDEQIISKPFNKNWHALRTYTIEQKWATSDELPHNQIKLNITVCK